MAAAAQAALLDELMGRNRNFAPNDKSHEAHWSDDQVCKHFLCGFCPCELFVNTRADLGTCEKLHDDSLKKDYENSSRNGKMGYEEDFIRYLQSLLSDVERRIRRGHARLALNSQNQTSSGSHGREEKIQMLTGRINELVEQAEELGCEGKVEEAQGVMKLCDQLREERQQLESGGSENMLALKEMEVCNVCGAFLIVGDAQQRLAEHLIGKQHMGYAKVRATIELWQGPSKGFLPEALKEMTVCSVCGALLVVGDVAQRVDEHLMGKQHMGYAQVRAYVESSQNKRRNETAEREAKLLKEREDREKEREKEREDRQREREEREKKREERRKRSRSRSRRSRSRDRRRRSRSRSKGRKRRSRSRSRDKKRSRSRDRRRSRSRDRRRSRSRDRRSSRRSRSRDRRHRSRDRSRDRRHRSRDRSRTKDKERSSRDKDRSSRAKSRDKSKDSAKDKADGDKAETKEQEEKTTESAVTENGDGSPSLMCIHIKSSPRELGIIQRVCCDKRIQWTLSLPLGQRLLYLQFGMYQP
ncbi:unnamed protein product [Owenia fusiformis]|uniref:Luc7-like protein 3 n=1 Tax=Owenia fusiformis TaxID=6347 RepID=A0A8S4PQ57_OWEFU|nr:unnamed protein product [Owenia fusiformis]